MRRFVVSAVILACGLAAGGCRSNLPPAPAAAEHRGVPSPALPPSGHGIAFTDVTKPAGITFAHSFGDTQFSNLAEAVGGGAVFFDADNDGWIDLYLLTGKWVEGVNSGERPAGQPLNRLYHNRKDGTFEDVTERAGVGAAGLFSTAASAADYDGDGDQDLYVCNYGRSLLFRNNGDGTFADVTGPAGVANPDRNPTGAVWFDYDRDGTLDLFVVNYIEFDPKYNVFYAPDGFPGPLAYKGQTSRLYRNRGNGTFEDVSAASGIGALAGRGMSATAADLDGDGFEDLYVANDQMENRLFHNDGRGHFTDTALASMVAYNGAGDSTASMGVDVGDIDGDGRLDLFVSDDALSSLYRNEGNGTFSDMVVESGIARTSAQYVGWGSFLFDYDNDGDLDLLKVNSDLSRLVGHEDQIYENLGHGRFEDVSDKMGPHFARALIGRGTAYGDYDNDGDLDVVIVNLNGPAVLLRNDGGAQKHWLHVRLAGRGPNRDGVGARVGLTAGGLSQVRVKRSSNGYLSQSDPRVHFGLADSRTVDRLEVRWPSGTRQVLTGIAADQVLTVQEPAAASGGATHGR